MMQLPSLVELPQKLRQLPWKIIVPIVAITLFIAVYLVLYLPKPVLAFSYSRATCVGQVTLFPDYQTQSHPSDFQLAYYQRIGILGIDVASLQVCVEPVSAPSVGNSSVHTSVYGGWLASRWYVVEVGQPPQISTDIFEKPLPLSRPLLLPMSTTDAVFSYALTANSLTSTCQRYEHGLACDLAPLELEQGKSYEIGVVRYFEETPVSVVSEKQAEILKAVVVAETSVQHGEVVYTKPHSITITFDKEIGIVDGSLAQSGDAKDEIDTSINVAGKEVEISWEKELARQSAYVLTVNKAEAVDGSTLVEPYVVNFETSGGPHVQSINLPKVGVALGATAVVQFDQMLKLNQNIAAKVVVSGGSASVWQQGNRVFLKLSGMGRCNDFTITIKDDLISVHDVSGGSAWSYGARTVCHTVETIGYSVQGRPINAYFYGNGSTTILYTGAIHGNELSSSYLTERWMDELEANFNSIPAGRQIVVVPEVNPDGVAAGTRNNANNVDLNRNFAVSDWQADITDTWGVPIKNGGGTEPMSEPETKALAALTTRLQPRLTLSFHSIGGVVIANQAADSNSLAAAYAQLTGYGNATGQSSATFDYAISGTYDDWIAEKLGLASVLVELGSHTYSQYPLNKAALWDMTRK